MAFVSTVRLTVGEGEMVEQHLEELEAKVQKMIDIIRRLRDEKALLEQRLAQRERELLRWNGEKTAVRQKIERILEDLNILDVVKASRGT